MTAVSRRVTREGRIDEETMRRRAGGWGGGSKGEVEKGKMKKKISKHHIIMSPSRSQADCDSDESMRHQRQCPPHHRHSRTDEEEREGW